MSQQKPGEPEYVSWITKEELKAREEELMKRPPLTPGGMSDLDISKKPPEPDLTVVDPD